MLINATNISALNVGFKANFKEAFDGAVSMFAKVATEVPSSTAENRYAWLGQFPKLREWLGDRMINNLKEFDYSLKNKTFESTVSVPKSDVEDDQYAVYSPLIAELGRAAKTHPDELVFALLLAGWTTRCYDGQYFFDTNHPVGGGVVSNNGGGAGTPWFLLDTSRALKPLIFQKRLDYAFQAMDRADDEQVFARREFRYGVEARANVGFAFWQMAYGSKQVLDSNAYAAAKAAMGAYKSDDGRPLGIRPTVLVVPPSLEMAAKTILKAQTGANGASNPWVGDAEVLVVPWLA
ncbi:MAG: Mu-like prophage major head subunit gpT family protein [Deltaproteobacteria bacterium]|nr:Mu-like prophage major head subunit gpT family protein [Deltaproteobacteria bacterium]